MLYAIGDVHGKIKEYEKILANIHKNDNEFMTIQIGDMGIGFKGVKSPKLGANDYFFTGNHDNYEQAKTHTNCLNNFGCWFFKVINKYSQKSSKLFYIRGAYSIDRAARIPRISWWESEEIDYSTLQFAINMYETEKPEVVFSHDCPQPIHHIICPEANIKENSRTVMALSAMFSLHRPKIWVFGHHHKSFKLEIEGCLFICLNELEVVNISKLL